MFKKLRNRLIWINLSITTIVIVTVFAAIYVLSTRSANNRPPMPPNHNEIYSDEVENFVEGAVRDEKQAAARELLVTLIVSGVVIELVVALVSYFLAEEAIKPVREAYESQKVFIANASHEIKTPLAAISANLEAADIRGNKWIANVERETEKLTALNSELLTLARTDLTPAGETSLVDPAKILEDNLKTLEPRFQNLHVEKKIITSQKIKINRGDFTQILNILLDNAIKYSNSKILITLNHNMLTIANDGTLISEKDLPHIFERFYQVDKTSEGAGLGLSIAKSVAERNGWELTAKSDDRTTEFQLKF